MPEQAELKRIHLIAIGGSIMHNLALALHAKGLAVSGTDDEIYEPARTRLQQAGLLPESEGWQPEKISSDLDAVIVGMHARPDNPELKRAQELGLRVYSFPEFLYEHSKDKQRIVIAGSHGKTTITSMIMHVLRFHHRKFDYAVGAQIAGFERMVQLTEEAPIIVIEGDEYLSSPIDRRPKFLHYRHHIGVISGIAWDHINVFPTYAEYKEQFQKFVELTPKAGILIYSEDDPEVKPLCEQPLEDVRKEPYRTHPHEIRNGKTWLETKKEEVPVQVFGKHNLQNLNAALHVCENIGISNEEFYEAIQTFTGAAKRLELLGQNEHSCVYRDFAHAPSKLKATSEALHSQYPDRELVACLELHTFSSLNKNFLQQYRDTFNSPEQPIVYFNPKTLAHKKLEPITPEEVKEAFGNPKLKVLTDSQELAQTLQQQDWKNKNLLLMSSGNFNNIDLANLVSKVIGEKQAVS